MKKYFKLFLVIFFTYLLTGNCMASPTNRIIQTIDAPNLQKGLIYSNQLHASTNPFRTFGSNVPTFTRASSGTYLGSNGLIQTASSNTPRFDYAQAGNAVPGALIEGQATNICTHSETFDNASWTATNGTVTADFAVAPDGNTTADEFAATGTNATIAQTITSASSAKVFSVWIKRETGTGTVSVSSDGTTFTTAAVNASWTRFSDTRTSTNPTVTIKVATSGDAVDLWGGDDETGSFATSYIPTTSATVTRAADVLSYPAAGNISASAGCVSFWLMTPWRGDLAPTGGGNTFFDSPDNSGQNGVRIVNNAGSTHFDLAGAAGTSGVTVINAWSPNVYHHFVMTWSGSMVNAWIDNVSVVTTEGAGFTPPTFVNPLHIGSYFNSTGQVLGDMRDLRIYSRVLRATEVAQLYGMGY